MQIEITNSAQSGPQWRIIFRDDAPSRTVPVDFQLPSEMPADDATQEVRIIPERRPRIYANLR